MDAQQWYEHPVLVLHPLLYPNADSTSSFQELVLDPVFHSH